MSTIAAPLRTVSTVELVTIGVDTHSDFHVAAALSGIGRLLGSKSFATTPAGLAELLHWSRSHGQINRLSGGAWVKPPAWRPRRI